VGIPNPAAQNPRFPPNEDDSRTRGIHARELKNSLHALFTRISAKLTCGIYTAKSSNIGNGTYGFFEFFLGGFWSLWVRCAVPHVKNSYFECQIHTHGVSPSQGPFKRSAINLTLEIVDLVMVIAVVPL